MEPDPEYDAETRRINKKVAHLNLLKQRWSAILKDYAWPKMYLATMKESYLDASLDEVNNLIFQNQMPKLIGPTFLNLVGMAERASIYLPYATGGRLPPLTGLKEDFSVALVEGHLDDGMNEFLIWLGGMMGVTAVSRSVSTFATIIGNRLMENMDKGTTVPDHMPQTEASKKNSDL
jgi:hypothetical protein